MEKNPMHYEKYDSLEDNPLLATAVTNLDLKAFQVKAKPINIYLYIMLTLSIFYLGIWIISIFLKIAYSTSFLICAIILVLLTMYYRNIKKEVQKPFKKGILERYEFYKNYILQRTLMNGEFIGEMKIFYKDIVRSKYVSVPQDAGYLILSHHNKYTQIMVHLQNMPTTEIEQLQKLFGIQLSK